MLGQWLKHILNGRDLYIKKDVRMQLSIKGNDKVNPHFSWILYVNVLFAHVFS